MVLVFGPIRYKINRLRCKEVKELVLYQNKTGVLYLDVCLFFLEEGVHLLVLGIEWFMYWGT
jgi:hypothetical protein